MPHILPYFVSFKAEDGGASEAMRPAGFAFEVAIDGVNIGSGMAAETMLMENLKKVIGIEGATTLAPNAFSSDNINVTFEKPVDGKAKLTVSSPADADNTYFMRVTMK